MQAPYWHSAYSPDVPPQQAATPQASPTQPPGYEEHNDADVSFAQQMIPLEQQAVAMSEALLAKPGVDRDVSDIARAIHENDRPEVVQLQQWLKDWGRSGPPGRRRAGVRHTYGRDPGRRTSWRPGCTSSR